jgi:DNA-binding transcriptional LysR family regulator
MLLDTQSLRTFVALAETRHFGRAAARIGRTQSAVSQQIKRLETEAGVDLFVRSKREVRLTAAGETFFTYARRMLDLQTDLQARLAAPDIDGTLRLGTPEDVAAFYLPTLLETFSAVYPRLALNVTCDLTAHLQTGLAENKFDLVILKGDHASRTTSDLILRQEPLVWAGRRQRVANLLNTDRLPLVLSPAPCVYRQRALASLEQVNRPWVQTYVSTSLTGNLAAVRAGLGLMPLPRDMVPDDLQIIEDARLPILQEALLMLRKASDPLPGTDILANFIRQRLCADPL